MTRLGEGRKNRKTRTGCGTCRIRKIKCDEDKPFCQKCVKTGRTCDGYESPFRFVTGPSSKSTKASVQIQSILPSVQNTTPEAISFLNHCFSTKTMFDVALGCDEEAKQILEASATDPHVRHAVFCLRSLRKDLDMSGDLSASIAQQTPNNDYGVQQYCLALEGLASKLFNPTYRDLKSALLCCETFISIEQIRGNYTAMAQHIGGGLQIMREHRARPCLISPDELTPAYPRQLPLVDVFIIKLFSAPCKFADRPTSDKSDEETAYLSPQSMTQPVKPREIVPNMKTELTKIATSTTTFLQSLSGVTFLNEAQQLLKVKSELMTSLDKWSAAFDRAQAELDGPELLSLTFMRLFYQILRIIILGTLESSSDIEDDIQTECLELQEVAFTIGERVKTYSM